MVLLYVPDRRGEDTRLVFDDMPEGWRVAVELESANNAGRTPLRGVHRARFMTRWLMRRSNWAPSMNSASRLEEDRYASSFMAIPVTGPSLPDALKTHCRLMKSRSWAARLFVSIYSCFMWGLFTVAEEWSTPIARRFPGMFPAS